MRVHVEWLDGELRTYERVHQAVLTRESNLLQLSGRGSNYVNGQHIASIPLGAVRAYKWEDD